MPLTQEQYYKKPEESIDQYNTRIADLRGDTITSDILQQNDLSSEFVFPQYDFTESASSLEIPEVPTGSTKTETEFESGRSRLDELNKLLTGESAFRAEQEQSTGFAEAQQTFDDLSQRLRDVQRQEAAIPLQIQQEFQGRGATAGGVAPIEAGRRREIAIEALTVSSLIDASSNRLVSAQRKVDRAVQAKYGPLIAEKEALLQNLQLIKDSPRSTREEKERADAQARKQEAEKKALEDKKQLETDILNFANSVAPQLAKFSNGSILLDRIQKAKTLGEAQKIAFDAGAFKDTEKLNTQIIEAGGRKLLINTQTGQTIKDLGGAETPTGKAGGVEVVADYGTDDYWLQLFEGSKGGKDLTGDQTTPLTKASIVLNQVGELATQINQTTTDPILGVLRDNNPYDVKARLIQAQLRSTVPNLARGVYGEVGVLTDADIANYIQTLPNIRTPQEANKLVLSMTLRTIQNSFRSYLETYANSGRDVSGFLKQYKAIGEKIDGIEQELGVGGNFEGEFNTLPDDIKTEKETFGIKDVLKFIIRPLGF